MSKLSLMFNKPEAVVAAAIERLEAKAGRSSEDVRLLAENVQTVKAKIAQLGLDPDDTTGEELYYALQGKYDSDAKRLEEAAGLTADSTMSSKLDRVIELIDHISQDETWSIKPAVIKRLLKALPPKQLIKRLGYRSADSCLKREDSGVLLAVAFLTESPTWKKQMTVRLKHLQSPDFEMRPARVVKLPQKGWSKVLAERLMVSNALAGVVAIWTDEASREIPMLSIALLALDELESISLRSAHKHVSVINPALSWWHGAEHLLAWNHGEPISLNFKDNALAHMKKLAYQDRVTEHAGKSLWESLLARYRVKIGEIPQELAAAEESTIKTVAPPEMALELEEA